MEKLRCKWMAEKKWYVRKDQEIILKNTEWAAATINNNNNIFLNWIYQITGHFKFVRTKFFQEVTALLWTHQNLKWYIQWVAVPTLTVRNVTLVDVPKRKKSQKLSYSVWIFLFFVVPPFMCIYWHIQQSDWCLEYDALLQTLTKSEEEQHTQNVPQTASKTERAFLESLVNCKKTLDGKKFFFNLRHLGVSKWCSTI